MIAIARTVSGCSARNAPRIGFTARWVVLRGQQLLVEALGGSDHEDWKVDHRRAPFLSSARLEAQPQSSNCRRPIRCIRLPAGKGKTADHCHAAQLKHARFRKAHSLPVAVEVAADAY